MAGKTISQMTSAGALTGDELLESVQGGSSRKVSLDSIKNWILSFVQELTLSSSWKFDESTNDSDPGNGDFRLNNILASNATYIYFNDNTNGGFDASRIISALKSGDVIYIQSKAENDDHLLATVNGDPVDAVGYWKIPITNNAASGAFTKNKENGVIFYFSG